MTPAQYRNLVNKLEKKIIFHAGEPAFQKKREEIDQIKIKANEEHGFIFKID